MSVSQNQEEDNYDQSDRKHSSRRNMSQFIQISLPSTRIEVPGYQILFKQNGQKYPNMQEVKAKKIKQNDLIFRIRDDKKVTEEVLEVKKVFRESLSESEVEDGMMIVNNVLMR